MDSKKKLLILIFVFVLLIISASILYKNLGEQMATDQFTTQPVTTEVVEEEVNVERESANNFTVYDVNGNAVKLSDYLGKPVVLNFWASWCGPCQMEMPDFNDKYLELGEDVQFLMINVTDGHRETVETASGFIKKHGYKFPVFYDTSYEAATVYNVYAMPTTYFIDTNGYIVYKAIGAIDAATLMHCIDLIRIAAADKYQ